MLILHSYELLVFFVNGLMVDGEKSDVWIALGPLLLIEGFGWVGSCWHSWSLFAFLNRCCLV